MPKRPVGRTPRLTKEITDRLCKMLQNGGFRNRAAVACGIGESTFYRWLELSRDRVVGGRTVRARPEYVEFREAIEGAEASAEQMLISTVRMAAYDVRPGPDGAPVMHVKDWRAAAYILERKYRDRWSEDPQVDETGGSTKAAAGATKKRVMFGGRWKEGGTFQPAVARRALGDGTPGGSNAPIDVTPGRAPSDLSKPVQPSAPPVSHDTDAALKAKVRELTTPPKPESSGSIDL